MKLRNKKTGEIVEVESCNSTTGTIGLFFAEGRECDRAYSSLAELNEEWEDYEEPKEYFYIYADGDIYKDIQDDVRKDNGCKEIGNYFETKEEAERAVEKLKAWKRLKDKGFRFKTWGWEKHSGKEFTIWFTIEDFENSAKDLNLLFGGEEDG